MKNHVKTIAVIATALSPLVLAPNVQAAQAHVHTFTVSWNVQLPAGSQPSGYGGYQPWGDIVTAKGYGTWTSEGFHSEALLSKLDYITYNNGVWTSVWSSWKYDQAWTSGALINVSGSHNPSKGGYKLAVSVKDGQAPYGYPPIAEEVGELFAPGS
jgi:hypothetical protein